MVNMIRPFQVLTRWFLNALGSKWGKLKLVRIGRGRGLGRILVAVAALIPLGLTWYQPWWLPYAVALAVALWLIVFWMQWSGWSRLGSWFVAGVVLACYWGSTFLLWLFLENVWFRIILLSVTAFFTWWYLREWQRLRLTLFLGEAGAGATPTLVLGFLSSFALGSAAENFLVFLNTPLWQLLLAFYLPAAALIICLTYASGWSLVKQWPYWFTGVMVLLQVFVLVTWWPTSFYVVGFTLAASFATIALVLRQEAQGFISRRSFSRELAVVLGALALVLLSARWY